MTFDIAADWTLNLLCNYRCAYCISGAATEHPLVGRLSASQHLDFFNSTGKTWLLHLTGGEPFLHPDFVGLCRHLTSCHYISVNSNLSSPRVRDFAARIDPGRVQYIHCGVHLAERDRLAGWRRLLANVACLLDSHFPVFASVVMTPETFAEFPRVAESFAARGVPVIPKAIRGAHHGRWYPQAYTESERTQFCRLADQAEQVIREGPWPADRSRATIDPLHDQHYLDGVPDFSGIPCAAGRLFVTIGYDGRIFRCGERTPLGHLCDGRLHLFAEDRPCDDEYCPYSCLRYSAFDQEARREVPRRHAPRAFRRALVTMRRARRELGNRITTLSDVRRP